MGVDRRREVLAVSAASTASAPSAISSPAPGPDDADAEHAAGFRVGESFVRPSVRPSVMARPEAAHWNFATFTARPARGRLRLREPAPGDLRDR